MTDLARWEVANGRYLTASLEWLRLRLERLARIEGAGDPGVQRGADARQKAAQMDPPPALLLLSQRLGLSDFERDILLLCAAMELDTRVAGLCAGAQGDPPRPYPTFGLALTLFDDAAWDMLSPERPLRYWRLVEIHQPGSQPLTASPLRADERIVSYLKGLNYLDDRLSPLAAPFEVREGVDGLPESQEAAVTLLLREFELAAAEGRSPVVQLVGADALSKELVARRAAAQAGLTLVRIPAAVLPQQASDIEALARLWRRETLLMPVALYLDAQEGGDPGVAGGQSAPVHRVLSRDLGAVFIATREVLSSVRPGVVSTEVTKPERLEQVSAWRTALGEDAAKVPELLGAQFDLNVPTIRAVGRAVRSGGVGSPEKMGDRAWQECVARTRPRLDQLAQRIEPRATWDDIVLLTEPLALLKQIAVHVRHRVRVYDDWGFRAKTSRGLGISALFAGESGTGKTMAAEVIANDLRLGLYRIDLSAVVSKYIGETEKNLRRVFDAAEDGGAILFFDEADALFGKRSEVKDSHDRYANIEINYLLQRMEAFAGVAILATNMRSALDQAFLRRLRFIVSFPFPGPAERKRIWERSFPRATPLERADRRGALDYDWLSRLNLTGGSIHNIVLHSAFLAAAEGGPVTMANVLDGARVELRKLEKPVNEADFRWQPKAVRPREAVVA